MIKFTFEGKKTIKNVCVHGSSAQCEVWDVIEKKAAASLACRSEDHRGYIVCNQDIGYKA